jgi:hypothetical protein
MASLRARWLLLVPICCSVLACSDSDNGRKIVRTTHESEGGLCLRSSNGQALDVLVVFPTCLSSSCDRELSTSCQVTRAGDQLVVTSHAETETTGADACTADCGSLVARCTSTVAVPPGPYTLIYGSEPADISLAQSPVELFADEVPFRPCSIN